MGKKMKKNNVLRTKIKALFSGLILVGVGAQTGYGFAVAQENPEDQENSGNGVLAMEGIRVTAQKRSQRLVDVPVSVTAISKDIVKSTSSERLSDLQTVVPNLSIESDNSFVGVIRLRGVGDYSRNIGYDTRVGVFLDGVYMGQSPAIDQELVELERVEVLRGPQGSLFGSNTVAGAINLVSAKPTSEFEGAATARFGNYGMTQVFGNLNVPLSEDVAFRISANKLDRDGYIENLATPGTTIANRDSFSHRSMLSVDFSDNLSMLAAVDGLKKTEIGDFGVPLSDPFGAVPLTETAERYVVNKNEVSGEDVEILGGSVQFDYDLQQGGALVSVTAYRDSQFRTIFDVDHGPADLFNADFEDGYKQFTQEFRLVSPTGGALEYVVGLFYLHQDSVTDRNAIPGVDGGFLGLPVNVNGELTTDSHAIFADFTYDLSSSLEAGFGFRIANEKKNADWSINGAGSPLFADGRFQDERKDDDFSINASLLYRLDDNNNIYARYSEGIKSGGFNIDFVSPAVFPDAIEFDSESVENIEIGSKGALFGGQLTYSVAGFWSEYDSYQVNQLVDLGNGQSDFIIGNAPVTTKGFEVEGAYHASSNLTFSGALGYVDPTFGEFPGGGALGGDVSDNRLPYASKIQASAAIDYSAAVYGGYIVNAHVDYSYQGDQYTTTDNVRELTLLGGDTVPFGYVPSYDLLNVRIGIGPDDEDWELAVWSRNALDSDHVDNSRREFLGAILDYYTQPRTYGVDLRVRF